MGFLDDIGDVVTGKKKVDVIGSLGNDINRELGNAMSAYNRSDLSSIPNSMADPFSVAFGGRPKWLGGEAEAPPVPGMDPTLTDLKKKQSDYAKSFRAGLPGMESAMGENLRSQANQGMYNNLNKIKGNMSGRGLLYGGMSAGAQAGERGKTQANVASGMSGIHQGLLGAADQLDAQAIETGYGIQKQQQDIQNQIYSQSLQQMNNQNSMAGGLLGTAATAAILL